MTPRLDVAFAILLVSCRDPGRSAAPTAVPEPARPAASSPAALASSSSPATATQAPPADPRAASAASAPRCDVDLPRRMEFRECYARPRTLEDPDCRTFIVERAEGDEACEPERLSIGVTGYQSILDDLRVTVRWEAGRPRRAKLFFERAVGSILGNDEKPGTPMGTLVFGPGGPREIVLGPGMRRYTDQGRAERIKP